jgi:hypothetical protein
VSSITIVSDAPNCGITYDSHYDDRNSFIIQATGVGEVFTGYLQFYLLAAYYTHSQKSAVKSFMTLVPALLRFQGWEILDRKEEIVDSKSSACCRRRNSPKICRNSDRRKQRL